MEIYGYVLGSLIWNGRCLKKNTLAKKKSNSNNALLRWYNPTYAGKNTYNQLYTDSIKANLNSENFYKGAWQQSDINTSGLMSSGSIIILEKI